MAAMSLEVRGICVALNNKEILHSVDLEIEQGELFSLLGPSGCGKTTLLKTLSGLNVQTQGSIVMNDRCLDDLPPEKRNMVVVFQDLRLFPNMNVAENVAFPLKMRRVGKAERIERAEKMLTAVQLKGFGKRRPSQLSGGQQQRVALARAIIARPDVLLLDEPFSSLDENLRDDMRELLASLHERLEMTMVLVTHDQAEALKLSDRIAIMKDGRVLQCADPRTIYTHPASLDIARYFADGNVIDGTVSNGTFSCPAFSCPCSAPDGDATTLVRASALSLRASGTGSFTVLKSDYLGDTKHLVVKKDAVSLEFYVDAQTNVSAGDKADVAIDCDKALVFSK